MLMCKNVGGLKKVKGFGFIYIDDLPHKFGDKLSMFDLNLSWTC